nr:Rab family GTPase [Candidatus Sigynarchaeota archaeon]
MTIQKFIFKIVVGGAGAVGKTTLLHLYLHNVFLPSSTMTIGIAFHSKEIVTDDSNVKLAIWDLGGQERFRFMQPSYCQGAKAGIVFFDMSRFDTISQVKDWVDMFRINAHPGIPIILGGTKLDLLPPDLIETVNDRAQEIAEKLGLAGYFPTSSKTNINVDELFATLLESILERVKHENFVTIASHA